MTPAQTAARASALLAKANGHLNLRIERKKLLRADVRLALALVTEAADMLRTLDANSPPAVLSAFSGESGDDHGRTGEATSTPGAQLEPGSGREGQSKRGPTRQRRSHPAG